jgi:hypothetical protein
MPDERTEHGDVRSFILGVRVCRDMQLEYPVRSMGLVLRFVTLSIIVLLLVPAGTGALTSEPQDLEAGTISDPANGTTVISVQGFKLSGWASGKKPA